MTAVWPTIERFILEHGSAVLVTVAQAQGSSPRAAGARMLVRPDGSFSGTIGGGALEWTALAEAQALLARPASEPFRRLSQSLGPDLGQCCGGRVVLTFERFDMRDREAVAVLAAAERQGALVTAAKDTGGRLQRRPAGDDDGALAPGADYARLPDGRVVERFGTTATPFYLFGAGHVGRALVLALAPLPFAVTWVDPRPSAFPTHIPANTNCRADAEPARLLAGMPDGAFIAIMTHSHALDLDIAAAALKAGRFPYVGLIGSDTKRARFLSTMHKLGMTDAMIDRLICPIGLTEIRDKAPAAIAAAIVAQLLIQRDALAQSASESEQVPTAPDLTGLRHA